MARMDFGAVAAVEEFAAAMNISAVADDDGAYAFEFSESGRLSMLAAEDGKRILVSLTRGILVTDLIGKGAVLAAGGYNPMTNTVLRPGITGDGRPVLTLDLQMQGLDLPTLDTAFQTLRASFEDVGL